MNKYFWSICILLTCFFGKQNTVFSNDIDSLINAGKKIYTQCSGCHALKYHRTGPKHCGLIGRKAGTIAGFEFTEAMKESNIIWTKTTLDKFLKAPLEIIPNTSMGFYGITSAKQRAELIAYLVSLTGTNSLCR
jgi:cytochrome c